MAKIKLVEVKSDLGGRVAGASLGADAMRIASYSRPDDKKFYSRFSKELCSEIIAPNKMYHSEDKYSFAKRIDNIYDIYLQTCDTVADSVVTNDFTIVVSGDHSAAGGTIAGIKQAFPSSKLGVIWIDAHTDVHNPYTSDSGNMHGMPLSTAINDDNLECKFNDISPETTQWWEKMKNIGGTKDKLKLSDVVYVAIRDYEQAEATIIKKYQSNVFTAFDVHKLGAKEVATQAVKLLEHCDIVYVSFDVDSMDPSVSIGTGTPFENGLYAYEAKELLKTLLVQDKIVCLEISEINPLLDDKNKMGKVAFDILKSLCRTIDLRKDKQ